MTYTGAEAGDEFDRQLRNLIGRGYAAIAGMGENDFAALLAPARETVLARAGGLGAPEPGRAPFAIVVSRELVPVERAVPLLTLANGKKAGVIDRNYAEDDIPRFVATPEVAAPGGAAYVVFDVQRGEEFCGAVPNDAMETVRGRGRTPLTIEEGIALVTQFPAMLASNKCFSLGGSRCGDRRVPALWISGNAPKLGWCWAGNPHTWLGMASAGSRAGGRAG